MLFWTRGGFALAKTGKRALCSISGVSLNTKTNTSTAKTISRYDIQQSFGWYSVAIGTAWQEQRMEKHAATYEAQMG